MAPPDEDRTTQIVGIDGSDDATHALRWALARTDDLGPVQPVMAWQYPWWALVPTATGRVAPVTESEFSVVAEKVAEHALAQVDPGTYQEPMVIHGSAGPTLVSVADHGSLLVVGSRGRGALASGLLGSVSLHCVHHASGPVAVIPTHTPLQDQYQRIVVGVDGSKQAVAALRWAIDNTPLSSRIDVVHAWSTATTMAEVAALATTHLKELSTELIGEAISHVRAQTDTTGRVIEAHSFPGDGRQVLRTESKQSDLLVVGARGHSRLVNLLLGSTASSLLHEPHTATVVVR